MSIQHQCILIFVGFLMSMHKEGMSTSSCLQIITLSLDMFASCIENLICWIKLIKFKEKSKIQLGKHIKTLRSDQGGDIVYSIRFFLQRAWDYIPIGCTQNSQQYGIVKRRNQTLMDMVRSMMGFLSRHVSFWGYALDTTTYLLNLVFSKSIPLTLIKMWKSCNPIYNTFPFGGVQHMC